MSHNSLEPHQWLHLTSTKTPSLPSSEAPVLCSLLDRWCHGHHNRDLQSQPSCFREQPRKPKEMTDCIQGLLRAGASKVTVRKHCRAVYTNALMAEAELTPEAAEAYLDENLPPALAIHEKTLSRWQQNISEEHWKLHQNEVQSVFIWQEKRADDFFMFEITDTKGVIGLQTPFMAQEMAQHSHNRAVTLDSSFNFSRKKVGAPLPPYASHPLHPRALRCSPACAQQWIACKFPPGGLPVNPPRSVPPPLSVPHPHPHSPPEPAAGKGLSHFRPALHVTT